MNRGLGHGQQWVLRHLRGASWPASWSWCGPWETTKVLNSLVRRGLVDCVEGRYSINAAGRRAIRDKA